MKKLLPAALFLMAVLTAPAQELPLLKWSSKDQQSLMKGTWWETCLLYTSPSPRDS